MNDGVSALQMDDIYIVMTICVLSIHFTALINRQTDAVLKKKHGCTPSVSSPRNFRYEEKLKFISLSQFDENFLKLLDGGRVERADFIPTIPGDTREGGSIFHVGQPNA